MNIRPYPGPLPRGRGRGGCTWLFHASRRVRGVIVRSEARDSERPIPKGLCPPAQGCEARATLGHRPEKIPNRKAVATDPHPNACAAVGHNPVGVVTNCGR